MAMPRPFIASCRWCLLPMERRGGWRRPEAVMCPRCDTTPTAPDPLVVPQSLLDEPPATTPAEPVEPEWRRERTED